MDQERATGWAAQPRVAMIGLTGLVVARAALYAVQGVNFILDDWTLQYLRATEGTWHSVPAGQDQLHARPGAWLIYTLLHGIVGAHPLVQFAVLTVANVAVTLVLYVVFTRFVDRSLALAVTAVWVVLPIHQSMTVWSGAAPIAVGTLALLLGVLALCAGRWFLAGLGLVGSILCYELSVPVAFAAALLVGTAVLPLRAAGSSASRLALTWRDRGKVVVMVALATWWSHTHAIYPVRLRLPNPAVLWSAHFGHGLVGAVDAPTPLVALTSAAVAVGVGICVVAWLRGERSRSAGPSLVVAGLVVFCLGLAVTLTVHAGALGFNDRLYSLSSIGAALMLTGVGVFAWRHRPALAAGFTVALVSVALVGQVVSMRSWSQAGADVVALLDHLETNYPDAAHTNFIVGPTPSDRNNVTGVVSPHGGAEAAFRVRFPEADPPCQPSPAPCNGSLIIARTADDFVVTERGETLIAWSDVLDD